MAQRAISIELMWDVAIPRTLETSQRWVLSTMQNHGRELVNMLWRILGNEQDVCDAYQDTFLKLSHHEFTSKPRNIKAYVFRSASNAAISILKRRLAEKGKLSSITTSKVNTTLPASNELDSRYLQEKLREGIANLSQNLREVITLHDLADLPYEQVGVILGLTPATARVYRCKAMQLLAVWMRKGTRK
jgi:RNA polymerase sigma factor (sigma-70 family)